MKKNYLKLGLCVLMAFATLGCGKEKESAINCSNVSASIVDDVNAYQAAVTKYSTSPTPANCTNVKNTLTAIINKVKDCPQMAPVKSQYELLMKEFTCN
ncbi:hypothetical protein BCY91_03615 [Pelobium manganitolerans]|uniref:Lipoprotein n=1 Tax=Pelobium manganitolerans TaxID=1842495 RepID=A0A419S7L2_9SPHI|nr:hypothetical protein [Pelobium manganitolerans]RKD17239.1 hypothetical protein BCY91_03615 [Pelobium manganitolerans]